MSHFAHIAVRFVAPALLALSAGCQAKPDFNVYFGNLHSHTSYSDGSGTPDEAYRHARSAGLDFLAITEHNHKSAESGAKDRRDGLLIPPIPASTPAATNRCCRPRRAGPPMPGSSRSTARSSAPSAQATT